MQKHHSFGEHSQQGVTSPGLALSSPWAGGNSCPSLARCILCHCSIRQNRKLDQERGGLSPSLLACCSQGKLLSVLFHQHLHSKQHYPCSATYPCPGKCPALKPECTKVFERQSSISSIILTLCWFGIGLKKSELCSFELSQNNLDLFQHLQVFDSHCQINLTVTLLPYTLLDWHRI